MKPKNKLPWMVYMIQTTSNSLYTGIAQDVRKRFVQHQTGKGAKFFRIHPPKKIVYVEVCSSKSQALQRERQIKKWSPVKKRELIPSISHET